MSRPARRIDNAMVRVSRLLGVRVSLPMAQSGGQPGRRRHYGVMALHRVRPTEEVLRRLLESATSASLTYAPSRCSIDGATPPGYKRRRWATRLADGGFEAAVHTLSAWDMHRRAGLIVVADGPVSMGVHIAMAAPLPLGWVDLSCRVVHVIDEPDRFGFAYGTLPGHPEHGEESFIVERSDGGVRLQITAVSRPAHLLARLAPLLANALQEAATQRYLLALRDAAAGS
jgi:uncharacterized protein (UPF0548 family)